MTEPTHRAINEGSVALSMELEQNRIDMGMLLHNAVRSNEQQLVKSMLTLGARVDDYFVDEVVNLRTPLRASCGEANVKLIRELLARGADVFAHFDHDQWTALHSAAQGAHDYVLKVLMMESPTLHENTQHDGFSIMHLLAECVNSRLLNRGVDILRWAMKHMPGLEVDPKSDRLGYPDWTPLHILCARGFVSAAFCLVRAGADLDARTGEFHARSRLLNAFACGGNGKNSQVARIECDMNRVEHHWFDKGLLPIHLAAFGGHLRTVTMLINKGQCVNAKTLRHRWTPLMYAVWSGNVATVRELCRVGGREAVNLLDRRGDGSEWTPLALAVTRWGPEMIQVLVAYGADVLVRLSAADFPGRAFLRHSSPLLLDACENRWSGPDSRISLLHLAVLRGNLEVLRVLLPLVHAAHFSPVRNSAMRASLVGALSEEVDRVPADRRGRQAPKTARRYCEPRAPTPRRSSSQDRITANLVHALDRSRTIQDQARARLRDAPLSEAQDCDPLTFCTLEGWSPAVLALLLHTVDTSRSVLIELVDTLPDPTIAHNTRADVFMELLATRRSLLEQRPDASPPVMPQRFPDVSDSLVLLSIDEFTRLCQAGKSAEVIPRILHATLGMACRLNRQSVVRHLLETGLCDPRCLGITPVENRPIHIATSRGFGHLAQLLLSHRADPLEEDRGKHLPISKLAVHYDRKVSELQARVAMLEGELREARGSTPWVPSMSKPLVSGMIAPRGTSRAVSPHRSVGLSPSRFDAVLHDSLM